jgi:hypothetical protein
VQPLPVTGTRNRRRRHWLSGGPGCSGVLSPRRAHRGWSSPGWCANPGARRKETGSARRQTQRCFE